MVTRLSNSNSIYFVPINNRYLQKIHDDLSFWNSFLNEFMNSEKGQRLGQEGISYIDYANLEFESGVRQWDRDEQNRSGVLTASTKLIGEIFERFVPSNSKILEIGSNTLDSNGLSYFASLLPEKIHKNVTFSDYISEVVQNESDKTSCSYRLLDIKQPPDDLKDSQYCVTAINVFDVIKRKDLFKVARGCEKILQKDGIAMVLADRPFDLSPLYDTHSLPEKLVVPWILYHREVGVKTVSVDELKPYLAQLNAPLSNFFERILKLTPTQRHEFLSLSLYKRSDLVFFLNDLMDSLTVKISIMNKAMKMM